MRYGAQSAGFVLFTSLLIVAIGLSGCSTSRQPNNEKYSPRVMEYGQPVPKGGGRYKLGKPYQVGNEWFYPKEEPDYNKTGIASWYGDDFHGRYTANGEIYDMDALTAAHPTLPIPSYVKVTNLQNGRTLLVRVNDRGPYAHNRVIDMSRYGATLLGFKNQGTAQVRVQYIGKAPLNGDDTYEKRFLASQPWYVGEGKDYLVSDARRSYDKLPVGSLPNGRNDAQWPADEENYFIQAGTYREYKNALTRKGQLERFGQQFGQATIKTGANQTMTMHRVLVGSFKNRTDAEQTLNQMISLGVRDVIIVRNERAF